MIGEVDQRLQIARPAGIVHQNVERAEMGDGRVDETFEVGLVHHVARHEQTVCARADFFQHLRALLGIAREQRDLGALGQKGFRDPAPHACRAPGDGGDFAFEFHAVLLCPVVSRTGGRAHLAKMTGCRA